MLDRASIEYARRYTQARTDATEFSIWAVTMKLLGVRSFDSRRLRTKGHTDLWGIALVVMTAAAGASCSSSVPQHTPLPTVPAVGKVLVNGNPAAGAMIGFYATSPADMPVIPRATVAGDGSYALSSYGEKDGAPVGEYNVSVEWRVDENGQPVSADAETGIQDRLGGRYANPGTSGLKAKVSAGESAIPTFNLH